jgi:hypothetical protein
VAPEMYCYVPSSDPESLARNRLLGLLPTPEEKQEITNVASVA